MTVFARYEPMAGPDGRAPPPAPDSSRDEKSAHDPGEFAVTVTEHQIKDRIKAVLAGTSPDSATSEHPLIVSGTMHPNQALQVLTLAQRTAEEHIAIANRQADKIRTDAQAAADKIAADAAAHSQNIRREADKVLADARATAERAAHETRARAEEARRSADQIVSDARTQAQAVARKAEEQADQLKLQAHQRYEDTVGSLGAKREALQRQIESLEHFDRDYRARLTSFMQNQLRALWVDVPAVGDELDEAGPRAQAAEPEAAAPEAVAPEAVAPEGAGSEAAGSEVEGDDQDGSEGNE